LVEFYAFQWNHYKRIHKRIQFVFRYLDRFFVSAEREDPNFTEILETYEFAIRQWKEKIFDRWEKSLIDEVIKYFKVEREGRKINEKIVGSVSCLSST
jgi:hypothetical protein